MAPRGNIETTLGHLGRSLTGGYEEEAIGRESHTVGSRGRRCCIRVIRNAGTETGDARVGK